MPNQVDISGIQIETYAQIVSDIINGNSNAPGLAQIYGSDINVASNSPDGQMVNIYALSKLDILNLCVAIYNSFDPDQAIGLSLDQIAQIAGLARKGGTYTKVSVTVTTSTTLNLNGIDTSTPYTISDVNGNQFYLIASASLSSGANNLNFQAVNIGYLNILANTLTQQITVIPGVISVNNPAVPYQVGVDQETDSNFRLRRQASTAFPAQGPLQALFAGLNSISNITQAVVYENNTGSTNTDGVLAHNIWVITDGGADADIANAIYKYRSLGIGMKGSVTHNITQIDSSTFTVQWDYAVAQNLYLKASLVAINGGSIDLAAIKTALVNTWLFKINEEADITSLDARIKAINPNVVCSSLGVSADGTTWVNLLSPTVKKNKFVLDVSRITLT